MSKARCCAKGHRKASGDLATGGVHEILHWHEENLACQAQLEAAVPAQGAAASPFPRSGDYLASLSTFMLFSALFCSA